MNRFWLAGVVLLSIALIVVAFVELSVSAGRGGETMPLYSNRRFDPYGTAALYRVMKQRADTVLSLERPRLSEEHRGVMLQVLTVDNEPWFDEMGDVIDNPYHLPVSMLLDWVAEGNTLIQMTRRKTKVMEELGVEFAEVSLPSIDGQGDWPRRIQDQQLKGVPPDELHVWEVPTRWGAAGEPPGPGNRRVMLNAPQPFAIAGPDGWQPHFRQGVEAYGGEIAHGKGSVIFVGSPSPALNHYLGEGDNLVWLAESLGDGVVVFDEWAHGVGHGGTVLETMAYFGLLPLLLQLPVWLLAYRWSAAGRRYAAAPRPTRRRSSEQQVEMLGRLYDQAWGPGEKSRRVYDEVLIRLADACRCRVAAVESRLKNRADEAANRGLTLIQNARTLASTTRPLCVSCNYDLSGTQTDNCPECGRQIPQRVRRLLSRHEFTDVAPADHDARRRGETALTRILNESAKLAQELKRA